MRRALDATVIANRSGAVDWHEEPPYFKSAATAARARWMSVLATEDQSLRQALERHTGQEKHMLAEVDRARPAARALEGDLAKEQQGRVKSEEAAAKRSRGRVG